MVSQKVQVKNPTGLHLGPAGLFCRTATEFESHISFVHGKDSFNAKSVLSVLGACVKQGDEILLQCEGIDEKEALRAMVEMIENGLGEC